MSLEPEGFVIRTAEATAAEKKEAVERLKLVLPHLFIAANMARLEVPQGKVFLATIAKNPDGSGRVTASFEAEAFLRDVEALVGPLLSSREEPA